MDGHPAGVGEGHDGRGLETRNHRPDRGQSLLRRVHHHVLEPPRRLHRVDPQQQAVDAVAAVGVGEGGLVGHQDRLGLENGRDGPEVVEQQGGAGGGEVHDGVGKAQRRRHLHRATDGDDLRRRAHLVEEAANRARVGGRDLGGGEVGRFLKGGIAQHRDHQRAVAEAERTQLRHRQPFLVDQVAADDPEIDRAEADVLRDVVVPAVQDRKRKVAAAREEALAVALEVQPDGVEQGQGVFGQPPGALNRELERAAAGWIERHGG